MQGALHARLENNVQVVARGSERVFLHPGDRAHLSFDHDFVHHFDRFGKTCGFAAKGAA